ncbi:MAG TPA: UV DNA damage repair endonuclease UvsE [Candidatus Hydrogenedens sp.]|nr:UV DNA damage repair endonuclease UvsE [Candidatus Hydrogenedens sp.]
MMNIKIRFGLCCIFREQNIKFRTVTAKFILTLPRKEQLKTLSTICLHNCHSLLEAVKYCNNNSIKAFRILSPLFPRYTHPKIGNYLEQLPDSDKIIKILSAVKEFSRTNDIRLSFHPDQFIVINSPNEIIRNKSIEELEYQGILAERVGADVINIHAGGKYGNKKESLERFIKSTELLSDKTRKRLCIENDDVNYTVEDLQPISKITHLPIVYDIHHHRCNPDKLSVKEATAICLKTWKRIKKEPYFHISSPKNGWNNGDPKSHSDFINLSDFPEEWLNIGPFTLDIEAKAKELAVQKLASDISLYLKNKLT